MRRRVAFLFVLVLGLSGCGGTAVESAQSCLEDKGLSVSEDSATPTAENPEDIVDLVPRLTVELANNRAIILFADNSTTADNAVSDEIVFSDPFSDPPVVRRRGNTAIVWRVAPSDDEAERVGDCL